MGNRDPAADAGGSEILPALQHLEQHALGFLVELQEADELTEDVVFGRAIQVELDRVFAEELAEFHGLVSLRVSLKYRRRLNLRSYPRWEWVSNADVAWT